MIFIPAIIFQPKTVQRSLNSERLCPSRCQELKLHSLFAPKIAPGLLGMRALYCTPRISYSLYLATLSHTVFHWSISSDVIGRARCRSNLWFSFESMATDRKSVVE